MGKCLFLCGFGFAGPNLALISLSVLLSSPLGLERRLVASGDVPEVQGVLILASNRTCWTKEAPVRTVPNVCCCCLASCPVHARSCSRDTQNSSHIKPDWQFMAIFNRNSSACTYTSPDVRVLAMQSRVKRKKKAFIALFDTERTLDCTSSHTHRTIHNLRV